MTSIAIHPGFAAAPAAEAAPRRAASVDNGFDDALGKPAAGQAADGGDAAPEATDTAPTEPTKAVSGKHGEHSGDDETEISDDDRNNDDDGEDLPPRVRAERALAIVQAWQGVPPPAAAQAAGDGASGANGDGTGTIGSTAAAGPTGAAGAGPVPAAKATAAAPAAQPAGSPLGSAAITVQQPDMVEGGAGPAGAAATAATATRAATADPPSPQGGPAADRGKGNGAPQGVTVSRTTPAIPDTASPPPASPAAKVDLTIVSDAASSAIADGKSAIADGKSAIAAPPTGAPATARDAAPAGAAPSPAGPTAVPQASAMSDGGGSGSAGNDQGRSGSHDADTQAARKAGAPTGTASAGATPAPATAQMLPASGAARSFAAAIAAGAAPRHGLAGPGPAPLAPAAQTLHIQLRPVELGAVTANLRFAGGQLSIDVQVETQEAHRRLSSDSDDIVKSLQSLGFQVDKVTVRQVQSPAHTMARDASAANPGGQTPFSMSGHSGQNAGGGRMPQGQTENRYESASERMAGTGQPAGDGSSRRGVFI